MQFSQLEELRKQHVQAKRTIADLQAENESLQRGWQDAQNTLTAQTHALAELKAADVTRTNNAEFERATETRALQHKIDLLERTLSAGEEIQRARDRHVEELEYRLRTAEQREAAMQAKVAAVGGEELVDAVRRDTRDRELLHAKIVALTRALNEANAKAQRTAAENAAIRKVCAVPPGLEIPDTDAAAADNAAARIEMLALQNDELENERRALKDKLRALSGLVQDKNPHALFEGLAPQQVRQVQLFALSLRDGKPLSNRSETEEALLRKVEELGRQLSEAQRAAAAPNSEILDLLKELHRKTPSSVPTRGSPIKLRPDSSSSVVQSPTTTTITRVPKGPAALADLPAEALRPALAAALEELLAARRQAHADADALRRLRLAFADLRERVSARSAETEATCTAAGEARLAAELKLMEAQAVITGLETRVSVAELASGPDKSQLLTLARQAAALRVENARLTAAARAGKVSCGCLAVGSGGSGPSFEGMAALYASAKATIVEQQTLLSDSVSRTELLAVQTAMAETGESLRVARREATRLADEAAIWRRTATELRAEARETRQLRGKNALLLFEARSLRAKLRAFSPEFREMEKLLTEFSTKALASNEPLECLLSRRSYSAEDLCSLFGRLGLVAKPSSTQTIITAVTGRSQVTDAELAAQIKVFALVADPRAAALRRLFGRVWAAPAAPENAWRALDASGDGVLTKEEARRGLVALAAAPSEEEIDALFDGAETIRREEFLALMQLDRQTTQHASRDFDQIDQTFSPGVSSVAGESDVSALVSLMHAQAAVSERQEAVERSERRRAEVALAASDAEKTRLTREVFTLQAKLRVVESTRSASTPQAASAGPTAFAAVTAGSEILALEALADELARENKGLKVALAAAADARRELIDGLSARAAEEGREPELMYLLGQLSARQQFIEADSKASELSAKVSVLEERLVSQARDESLRAVRDAAALRGLAERLSDAQAAASAPDAESATWFSRTLDLAKKNAQALADSADLAEALNEKTAQLAELRLRSSLSSSSRLPNAPHPADELLAEKLRVLDLEKTAANAVAREKARAAENEVLSTLTRDLEQKLKLSAVKSRERESFWAARLAEAKNSQPTPPAPLTPPAPPVSLAPREAAGPDPRLEAKLAETEQALAVERLKSELLARGKDTAAEQTHLELLALAQKTVRSLQTLLAEKDKELEESEKNLFHFRSRLNTLEQTHRECPVSSDSSRHAGASYVPQGVSSLDNPLESAIIKDLKAKVDALVFNESILKEETERLDKLNNDLLAQLSKAQNFSQPNQIIGTKEDSNELKLTILKLEEKLKAKDKEIAGLVQTITGFKDKLLQTTEKKVAESETERLSRTIDHAKIKSELEVKVNLLNKKVRDLTMALKKSTDEVILLKNTTAKKGKL